MAHAKQTRTVSFSLDLTEDEATLLVDVLMHIGGMPESRRGIGDGILEALKNAGAKEGPNDSLGETKDIDQNRRQIYFTN